MGAAQAKVTGRSWQQVCSRCWQKVLTGRSCSRMRPLLLIVWVVTWSCTAEELEPPAGPTKIGDEHSISIAANGQFDVQDSGMQVEVTTAQVTVFTLRHVGASYIALHFDDIHLTSGTKLTVCDGNDEQCYIMTGRGKKDLGQFWARHVIGDTVVMTLEKEQTEAGTLLIDAYVAGYAHFDRRAVIGGSDERQNAICYQNSHPTEYAKARAVARLYIRGGGLCTGWLVGESGHLITNEHCITTQDDADNTDYEFMGEASSCGDNSGDTQFGSRNPGGIYDADDGATTLIRDVQSLDYALVLLDASLSVTYGYLEISWREHAQGEEIYIPQHGAGHDKELAIYDNDGLCTIAPNPRGWSCTGGSDYDDILYKCDTEGGSSGSPVLARSDHKVIALHHCGSKAAGINLGVPITEICADLLANNPFVAQQLCGPVPTPAPTATPTTSSAPSASQQPSASPSASQQPSGAPSSAPSSQPSGAPSSQPSGAPSSQPSSAPSSIPSELSASPSSAPSPEPSSTPTAASSEPTDASSAVPSVVSSSAPSAAPSSAPSSQPSAQPSSQPSSQPSNVPSSQPSSAPSSIPSSAPS